MKYLHILDRLFGTPLLILPTKAEVIAGVVLNRVAMGGPDAEADVELEGGGAAGPDASRFTGTRARQSRPTGLVRATDGVAIIDVQGSLVNRGAWVGSYSGMTSYEGIEASLKDAANDPEVHSILLDINSPGGEASGMFNLAEQIRGIRDRKPVVAVVNDVAASAAYGIASAANEIVISPTSIAGSIGVVMMHIDRSGEMAKAGIRPTLIHAGAHKVDGHPFAPLSEDVRADLQKSVDTFYSRFIETVAAGRGNRTTADMARATEARTFIGQEAIDAGLADRVGTFDQVLSELSRRQKAGLNRSMKMTDTTTTPAPGFTQAQLDAARAEGAAAERIRVLAILDSKEAKGREATARVLISQGMAASDAIALLASIPCATEAEGAPPPIDQRQGQPEIGASAAQLPKAEQWRAGWKDAAERINARNASRRAS